MATVSASFVADVLHETSAFLFDGFEVVGALTPIIPWDFYAG